MSFKKKLKESLTPGDTYTGPIATFKHFKQWIPN